ncbi:acetyltransferase [Paenibacillus sp. CCS19]|uniref:GNAT family N-acetyltransferase n=1 Tax=Paenibacillus sp. CCS19 TaxID=3158387 RepID=UPI00256BA418|nr:GNAT family N-acetyltransferase [Paenibacillus cellulosilyticus]GMK37201.1 acetyltransferase [Paenibacillus cellulosilyticus]
MSVSVELKRVTVDELNLLRNLFELTAYDLSELSGANILDNGQFIANLDVRIWYEDPHYDLLLIRVDEAIAGFVVIKNLVEEQAYYLNHFFVLRKFRRKRVGKRAAIMAFDRYIGKWQVSQFDWNEPAQQFWRRVIQDYVSDPMVEARRADDKGPLQHFTNYDRKSVDA